MHLQQFQEVPAKKGQGLGMDAVHQGKLVGALESDATVFSFYATKTITTGEGGMVVTRNPKLADRCRVMRLHGIGRDVFNRYNSKEPAWYYEVVAPGFKYNMTDLAAALGIHQLKKAWLFHSNPLFIILGCYCNTGLTPG